MFPHLNICDSECKSFEYIRNSEDFTYFIFIYEFHFKVHENSIFIMGCLFFIVQMKTVLS